MTTLLPTNMPKPAMISTNRAWYKRPSVFVVVVVMIVVEAVIVVAIVVLVVVVAVKVMVRVVGVFVVFVVVFRVPIHGVVIVAGVVVPARRGRGGRPRAHSSPIQVLVLPLRATQRQDT